MATTAVFPLKWGYHAHCAAAVLLFAYKHALKIHISALRHPSHHDKFDIVTTNEILDCQSQEIQIVPDSEFLGGGKRSGQCDGWSYHIELI